MSEPTKEENKQEDKKEYTSGWMVLFQIFLMLAIPTVLLLIIKHFWF